MLYKEPQNYNVVDGRRVPLAPHISETKYGRTYNRLDAPFGYKQAVKYRDDSNQSATIYVTKGIDGSVERYALVQRPTSDPLVAIRCFKLT
jgi:hypothetical protein